MLNLLVIESRKWSTSWDENKKFQVKGGTRYVIVDLEYINFDCRLFDLSGIPCQHAIVAIH